MYTPTGLSELSGRPPTQGVENSPPTVDGGAFGCDQMRCLETLWCLIPTVDRVRAAVPPFRSTCCEFFTNDHAAASASTAVTRAPAACNTRTDSPAVAPVVTMSSTSN